MSCHCTDIRSCSLALRHRLSLVVGGLDVFLWTALGFGKWKGGFPGGEDFFKKWVDDGMTGEVPDLPEELQSKTPFQEPDAVIDPREWYADMVPVPEGLISQPKVSEMIGKAGDAVANAVDDLAAATGTAGAAAAAASGAVTKVAKKKVGGARAAAASSSDDGPNPALYEQFYPADKRYLAPHIAISEANDRVGLSMNAVEAGFYERYFPKERLNKAPVIDIFYSGSLNTASVSLKMEEVEGLPAVAVVPKGDVQTSLVPSSGGGLKLDFSISGGEALNAYSDPRGVDKYQAMLQKAQSTSAVPAAARKAAPSAPSVKAEAKKVAVKAAAPAKKAGFSIPNPFAKK